MNNILYEDSHILVAVKEPGMPIAADKTGADNLLDNLSIKYGALYLISRLDRPVGGVTVFARTRQAAAFLSGQMQNNEMEKTYWAVVCGIPPEAGQCRDYLCKNQRDNMSFVVSKDAKNAKEAQLNYRRLCVFKNLSLLEIKLITGRHHQIRVQMKNLGVPIWGDTKYNDAFDRGGGHVTIGLWAKEIKFLHPKDGRSMCFSKEPTHHPFANLLALK